MKTSLKEFTIKRTEIYQNLHCGGTWSVLANNNGNFKCRFGKILDSVQYTTLFVKIKVLIFKSHYIKLMGFSQFRPKKVYFKSKIYSFLTFIFISFLAKTLQCTKTLNLDIFILHMKT